MLLKGTLYPKFIPKCVVKEFHISGWKVAVLNHEPHAVLLRRLSDDHCEKVLDADINKNFLFEHDYINFIKSQGYQVQKKVDHLLYFIPLPK